jgi:hypothetical protein
LRPSGAYPKPAANLSQTSAGQQQPQTDEELRSLIQTTVSEIEEFSTGGVLATCDYTGLNKKAGLCGPASFAIYRKKILEKFGVTTDPVEIMFVDQLLMAQSAIGSMHLNVHAAKVANDADTVAVLTASLARLMAEFRKSALALKQYKSPSPTSLYTVVQQQNVAAGDQQVAFVEGPCGSAAKKSLDIKQGSNRAKALTHEPRQELLAKPKATGGGEAESVPSSRNNTRGAATASRHGQGKPSVAPSHRSKNGRR